MWFHPPGNPSTTNQHVNAADPSCPVSSWNCGLHVTLTSHRRLFSSGHWEGCYGLAVASSCQWPRKTWRCKEWPDDLKKKEQAKKALNILQLREFWSKISADWKTTVQKTHTKLSVLKRAVKASDAKIFLVLVLVFELYLYALFEIGSNVCLCGDPSVSVHLMLCSL